MVSAFCLVPSSLQAALPARERDAALAIQAVGGIRRPAHQRLWSAAEAQQRDGVPARRRPGSEAVIESQTVRADRIAEVPGIERVVKQIDELAVVSGGERNVVLFVIRPIQE